MNKFLNLVEALEKEGYPLQIEQCSLFAGSGYYYFCQIRDKTIPIVVGFCSESTDCYKCLNNKIAADNAKCFDKWSKCCLNLPIPSNDKEMKFLLEKLKWLATDEAYEISNNFEHEKYITEYPKLL